jgi:hypothetical protein
MGLELAFAMSVARLTDRAAAFSKVGEEVNDASGLGTYRNVGPDRKGGRRRAAADQS